MTVLEDTAQYIVHHSFSEEEHDETLKHVVDSCTALFCGKETRDGKLIRSVRNISTYTNVTSDQNIELDKVLLYSAFIRLTEIDDIHLSSCVTPGSVILPTAMVLKSEKISEKELLDSIIVGYDMITRLGRVINGPNILYKGIWPTYFCAPFGAAATASRLLKLSVEQTAHALALALTMSTGGVSRSSHQTFRWFTLGHATRAGTLAAIMASFGLTGDKGMLDSDWFQQTYGIQSNVSLLNENIGNRSVMKNISLKPYCAAKQVIPLIYGLEKVIKRNITVDEIIKVNIKVPKQFISMINHNANDRMSSLTSASYQLALLAFKPGHLYDIRREKINVTDSMEEFVRKINISEDENLSRLYPEKWGASIEVFTNRGMIEEQVEEAMGDPGEKMFHEDIMRKSNHFLSTNVDGNQKEKITQILESILWRKGSLFALLEQIESTSL